MADLERRGGKYSEEDIERGLHALALSGGNASRAQRQLKAEGLTIPASTLEGWRKNTHADRYATIRYQVIPQIHAKLAEESEDLAAEYAKLELETIARFRKELPNLKASEAAGAARNIATSRAIAVDKASLLRGRPTTIVEHKTVEESLRKLAALGVIDVDYVDGTADELPPAA